MKLFKRYSHLFEKRAADDALRQWANVEYKHDSEFAYNHMKKYGFAPTLGVKC